jgi:hypothetical protein
LSKLSARGISTPRETSAEKVRETKVTPTIVRESARERERGERSDERVVREVKWRGNVEDSLSVTACVS